MAQIKRLVALVSIIATLLGLAPQAQAEGYFRHAAIAGFIDGFAEIGASQACQDLQDHTKTPDHRNWLSKKGLDRFFARVDNNPEWRRQFVEQAPAWVVKRSDNPNSPDRYWLRCTVWAIFQNRGGNFWLEGQDAWMYEGEPSWVFPILGLEELIENARADALEQARLEWSAKVRELELELADVKADHAGLLTYMGVVNTEAAKERYTEAHGAEQNLNGLLSHMSASSADAAKSKYDTAVTDRDSYWGMLSDLTGLLGIDSNNWSTLGDAVNDLTATIKNYKEVVVPGLERTISELQRSNAWNFWCWIVLLVILILFVLAAIAYFWRRKKSEPAKDATKDEAELARVKADHERVLRDKDNDISAKNSRIADQAEDLRRKEQTIQTLGRTIERLEQSISWLKMALGLAAKPLVLTGTGLRYIGGEPTIFYANDRYKAGTRFEPLVVIPGDANKMPRAQVLDRLRNDSSFRQQMGVELEEAGQEAA